MVQGETMALCKQKGLQTHAVEVSFGRSKTSLKLSISSRSRAPTRLEFGGKLDVSIKMDVAKRRNERTMENGSS